MKTIIKSKKLSALFGVLIWHKNTVVVKANNFDPEISSGIVSLAKLAFIKEFKSWDYPDPETLPTPYDPQRDGN